MSHGGTAGLLRLNTDEPSGGKVQPIDEGLDESHRVVLTDVIVRITLRRNPSGQRFHTIFLRNGATVRLFVASCQFAFGRCRVNIGTISSGPGAGVLVAQVTRPHVTVSLRMRRIGLSSPRLG